MYVLHTKSTAMYQKKVKNLLFLTQSIISIAILTIPTFNLTLFYQKTTFQKLNKTLYIRYINKIKSITPLFNIPQIALGKTTYPILLFQVLKQHKKALLAISCLHQNLIICNLQSRLFTIILKFRKMCFQA